MSKYKDIQNEILGLGFKQVSESDKETEFVIQDSLCPSSSFKVSLFYDELSCPVFIRSFKTDNENDYGEIVAGYYLFKKGDFTELLARLVGWFKFIDKVSDAFKIIAK